MDTFTSKAQKAIADAEKLEKEFEKLSQSEEEKNEEQN